MILWTILEMNEKELRKNEKRRKKLISMHKMLHPGVYVDKIYVSRIDARRELASIVDCVNARNTLKRPIAAANNNNSNIIINRKTTKP